MAVKEYSHYIYHLCEDCLFFYLRCVYRPCALRVICGVKGFPRRRTGWDYMRDPELGLFYRDASTILNLAPLEQQTTAVLETSKNGSRQPCSR